MDARKSPKADPENEKAIFIQTDLVSNVSVTRSVDAFLDDAAKEAVEASPKWEPGMQREHPVKVRYSIPIIFQIEQLVTR
jgi:hypothetical protein